MISKALLASLLVMMVALSGCIVDGPLTTDGPTDSGTDAAPARDDGAGNTTRNDTSAFPEPTAPDARIGASTQSGTVPVNVLFTLSSDSQYAAHLDWSFDADGDGTAEATGYGLPHEIEHDYEEAGNYTATLAVTDPEGMKGSASLDVTVEPLPAPEIPDPIVFTGTATGVYPAKSNIEYLFNVTPRLNNMTVTFEVSDGGIDYDFYLYEPGADEPTHEAAKENEPTGTVRPRVEPPLLIEAPKAGEWRLEVSPFLSLDAEYTVTITFA